MLNLKLLSTLVASTLVAYLIAITPLSRYLLQIIAILSIFFIAGHFSQKLIQTNLIVPGFITFVITIIIFTTGGLASPLYFLVYFLLFVLAFENHPLTIVSFTICLIFMLAQYLDSLTSLLPLGSILFISPLAWFVSQEHLKNYRLNSQITKTQTDTFMWISLRLKNSLTSIIDSLTMLSLDPQLTLVQKRDIINIRKRSKNLLTSSNQILADIEEDTYDD